VFSALGVAIVAALTVFSPIIIELLAGPSYITSAQLVPLLAVSIIFGGMYIFAPGLSLEKRSKEIALISIFGAVLNLGLNLIFIPIMGLFGAAWATVISSACTAVAWLARGQRWYQIPFAKKELSIIFVVLVFTWIFASQMASLGWIAKVAFLLTSLVFIYLPLRSLFDSMSKSMAKKID
jgi:O-antigen/teichoic acid export membrane protein